MARLELRVDRIRCDGAGLCAELLPEIVSLDDWGYPIVAPGAVPDVLLDHARRAVEACPVLALRLAEPRRASTARRATASTPATPRPAAVDIRWQPPRGA
ncbi:MAG TPA: ferredoxin [Candidatus Limnocylindrales bacterium]